MHLSPVTYLSEGIEPEELEDYLASLLDQEFDTIVDDGSLKRVSAMVVEWVCVCVYTYVYCASVKYSSVASCAHFRYFLIGSTQRNTLNCL